MNPMIPFPAHDRSGLPKRVRGTLGSASDRDLDAHLLVCDMCLAHLIAHVVSVTSNQVEIVPA